MDNIKVRIHTITLHNFKNVEFGIIDFACSKNVERPVDIMGLYGQNGSGKTALIDAILILKMILSGQSLPESYVHYINIEKEFSQLEFVFEVKIDKSVFKVEYKFDLVKRFAESESNIIEPGILPKYRIAIENEVLRMGGVVAAKKFIMQTLMDTSSAEVPFSPETKLSEIIGNDKNRRNKLMVNKQITKERSQSFIFSKDFLTMVKEHCSVEEYWSVINALVVYGNFYLYVVDTRSAGLINLNAALPFLFRLGKGKVFSGGSVAIKLEGSSVVPTQVCDIIQRAIENMNTVLEQIVPGLNVKLENLGSTLLPDKSQGCIVELISIRDGREIPLRYESEGIKKIVSILQLLIGMYNNEGITVAIDELDAGIFEYLLGELLKIISESGKGQLIFTSHNLRPLETIEKRFIYFTTSNPAKRYIQLKNISANNNVRDIYYRDLTLGGQDEELYERTNNYEIALSFKEAGEFHGR